MFVMEETGGLVPEPRVKEGLWKPKGDLLLNKYVEARGEASSYTYIHIYIYIYIYIYFSLST